MVTIARVFSGSIGVAAFKLIVAALIAQPAPPASERDKDILPLEEFTVRDSRALEYEAADSLTATGIGTEIAQTPLAISVVTRELIQDAALFEMREALNFVPGVLTNPRSESAVTIRAFNGLASYRNGQYRRQLMTTWNMDRTEVIKGPSAIFFGTVRPGGVVNNITVKPQLSGTFTDAKLTIGSEDFVKGEVFHNQKLNERLAIRVGVGGLDVNGARTFEYRHEYYLGLSALWRPTQNQQFTFDVEGINRRAFYLNAYATRSLANSKIFGAPAAIAAQASLNRQNTNANAANRSYLTSLGYSATVGAPDFHPLHDIFAPYSYGDAVAYDATHWQESRAFDVDYLLKVSGRIAWQTTLNHALDDTDGIQPSDGETRPYADGSLRFRVEDFINIRHSWNAHNKLTWRFDLGSSRHTLQIAHEYQRILFRRPGFLNSSNQYNDSPGNTGPAATNPYVVNFRPGLSRPVSLRSIITSSGQRFNVTRDRYENSAGFYIIDQARLLNERLFLLGGVRNNRFTGKIEYDRPVSNSSLSTRAPAGLIARDVLAAKGRSTPQLGALVRIAPSLSLFSTYGESIEPHFQLDADGIAAEPIEGRGWDIGAKSELFRGHVTSTIAFYEIRRKNLAYRDTSRELTAGRSPYFIFGNAEGSKGTELDLHCNVGAYQGLLAWSHIGDAKTIRSNNATLVGRRFGGVSKSTLTLWNRYTFSGRPLPGLTVAFGARHNSETNLSQDPDNQVRLPAFTVWDAMVSYRFRAFARELRAQLNVKNLTDRLYREGSDGFFGQRRTSYLSLSARL